MTAFRAPHWACMASIPVLPQGEGRMAVLAAISAIAALTLPVFPLRARSQSHVQVSGLLVGSVFHTLSVQIRRSIAALVRQDSWTTEPSHPRSCPGSVIYLEGGPSMVNDVCFSPPEKPWCTAIHRFLLKLPIMRAPAYRSTGTSPNLGTYLYSRRAPCSRCKVHGVFSGLVRKDKPPGSGTRKRLFVFSWPSFPSNTKCQPWLNTLYGLCRSDTAGEVHCGLHAVDPPHNVALKAARLSETADPWSRLRRFLLRKMSCGICCGHVAEDSWKLRFDLSRHVRIGYTTMDMFCMLPGCKRQAASLQMFSDTLAFRRKRVALACNEASHCRRQRLCSAEISPATEILLL